MKKDDRKKQLQGRLRCAAILIVINLFWIILFFHQFYEAYVKEEDLEHWQTLKIHQKVIVLPEDTANVTVPMGTFKLTAYCACEECCEEWAGIRPVDDFGNTLVIGAAGTLLEESKSIAVDPDVIPYGTKVIINGIEYIAADCGGDIKGNWIDIYMEDHERAKEFGVEYEEVYIVYDSNTGT